MSSLVAIRESPLSLEEVEQSVSHDGAGAVVTFAGKVRNHSEGRVVTRLEYEAYPSMAVREMTTIVSEIEARVTDVKLAVVHRTGTLKVGDLAIVCAASAPHRAEAFEACRQLIDEVKSRVPIWKREHGPDGPYWVGWEDARCHGHHGSATVESARVGSCTHHHEHDSKPQTAPKLTLSNLRIDCITVSDSRHSKTDESGALAEQLFCLEGAVVTRKIVTDDAPAILQVISDRLKSGADVVFLTGGTGLGPRDVTIPALEPLFERKLDGFGEAFRRLSFDSIGTRGLLSRASAGTVGKSIVFAVPGSPNAVRLAISSLIIPLVPHARAMILGGGH
jgi:molybdenum cofactor synthesis domain-containing protein